MKKKLLLLIVLFMGLIPTVLKAQSSNSAWKLGISFTHDLDYEDKGCDRTYLISADGAYRIDIAKYFFAEGNISLYYQKFYDTDDGRDGGPITMAHPWGLGFEPEALIGGKWFSVVEVSTGPSLQYLYAFHKDNWANAKRFAAFWNFRIGCTIMHKFNPYVECKLRMSNYDADTSKILLSGGIYYCF